MTLNQNNLSTPRIQLSPSILSADLTHLAEQVQQAEAAGADRFHVDVMDGHFVPSFGFNPKIVDAVRRSTSLPIDVHLMIERPDPLIQPFIDAGATGVLVHVEGNAHLHRTVDLIRSLGCQVGVAINPATPVMTVHQILPFLDIVLVMTVNPGFGGQFFIEATLSKILQLRQRIDSSALSCSLMVDGGITPETGKQTIEAGADILVAGTAVYDAGESVSAAIARFKQIQTLR